MRNAAGQLANALHFLRLAQALLGGAPLGQIAGDLCEADDFAVGTPDCIDHHACPKPGTVLADPPALHLVLSGPGRGLKRPARDPRTLVFLDIETRKMLSDYFFPRIALDARCAG